MADAQAAQPATLEELQRWFSRYPEDAPEREVIREQIFKRVQEAETAARGAQGVPYGPVDYKIGALPAEQPRPPQEDYRQEASLQPAPQPAPAPAPQPQSPIPPGWSPPPGAAPNRPRQAWLRPHGVELCRAARSTAPTKPTACSTAPRIWRRCALATRRRNRPTRGPMAAQPQRRASPPSSPPAASLAEPDGSA